MANKGKVYISGKFMSAKKFAEAHAFNQGCSKYIKARRVARERARQIREKNGPRSMEWVQSALFLYACKKHKLDKDMRRAIWAYTSALVVKLEEFVTNAEKVAERENIADSFHWVALQLRYAVRQHMKLLDMFKDEEISIPPVTHEGKCVCGITHSPTDKDSNGSMDYMLTTFRQKNPDAAHLAPKEDLD